MQNILKIYYGIDLLIKQYGYFSYQGQYYYFCYIEDIHQFLDTYHHYRYLMHLSGIEGYSLVKNNNQDIVSDHHVLLIYHSLQFSFTAYLQVFMQPINNQHMKIAHIKEQWILKIDCVRECVKDYAYSFKHDQDIISLIYYYCGIAENSINVLNEILLIHSEASIPVSLSLNYPIQNYVYEIVNPCHYIFSSRCRHIVCLLQSGFITTQDVQELLETQYFHVYEILYLFARILYPTRFFDAVVNKQMTVELVKEYYLNLEKERIMYKEIMHILSFYVTLPKISWITEDNMV